MYMRIPRGESVMSDEGNETSSIELADAGATTGAFMKHSLDEGTIGQVDPLEMEKITERVDQALAELIAAGSLHPGAIIVLGVSTSEVAGRHIGTSGSMEIASAIYEGVRRAREKVAFYPAFQCCEHLNRALVIEQELLLRHTDFEPVSVIPVRKAGGAMATYAYRHLSNPVVVETVRAHAGIDIGATLIGMHLRVVAVPVRPTIKRIGAASLHMAYSRPKLIGGPRAVYDIHTVEDGGGCD